MPCMSGKYILNLIINHCKYTVIGSISFKVIHTELQCVLVNVIDEIDFAYGSCYSGQAY